MKKLSIPILIILGLLMFGPTPQARLITKVTNTPTRTQTTTSTPTESPVPTATWTSTETPVPTITDTPTDTLTPSATVSPTPTHEVIAPDSDANLCPDTGENHDTGKFHTLWDDMRGCHYDHEHGTNPFITAVSSFFSGLDLYALLGNVEVGHTNPSSPMENTHKHGGFKWNVQLIHPQGCAGFEGAGTGVNGSVIQYHGFGDYAIEAEARIHSTVALLRQCRTSNPDDYGYIFVNQLQDYGQRIAPYQGTILPYENQPIPAYDVRGGPYLSFLCIDLILPYTSSDGLQHCRGGLPQAQRSTAQTNWTSKITHGGHSDSSPIFRLLWRARDNYRIIRMDNWPEANIPFEFLWLCTSDGGATYNPQDCGYNNTTTQVQEVAGMIPFTWDNKPGWDMNPVMGRVTAEGYVTKLGVINTSCTEPSTEDDCFPVKLINAFTGMYGSVLVFSPGKGTNVVPGLPERDIYFCNGIVCSENSTESIPSGWVGDNN